MAEGEAIRDAARAALAALGIEALDQDEKSIAHEAARLLGVDDCDGYMKTRRCAGSARWTKEERTLALGAWLGRR